MGSLAELGTSFGDLRIEMTLCLKAGFISMVTIGLLESSRRTLLGCLARSRDLPPVE